MESQRRIDPAAIFQLAAVAASFAAIAVYVTSFTAGLGLLPIVVIAVTAAAAGVLVQYWEWERLGGRPAVVMTNRWIRSRTIPSSVPREVWQPLLSMREARAARQWSFLILAALQIPLSVINLLDATSTTASALWICALVFWGGLIVWTLYYNLRWLPVIRRLLRQRRTSEALPITEDQHVHSDA